MVQAGGLGSRWLCPWVRRRSGEITRRSIARLRCAPASADDSHLPRHHASSPSCSASSCPAGRSISFAAARRCGRRREFGGGGGTACPARHPRRAIAAAQGVLRLRQASTHRLRRPGSGRRSSSISDSRSATTSRSSRSSPTAFRSRSITALVTAFFTFAICIPLGIVKAIRHRTAVDNLTSVLIFIGYAIPGFALGAVLVNMLAVQFQIFPARRLPVGRRRRAAVRRQGFMRHRLALGAAAHRLSRRRIRHRDHADEEQPDGEHERRLCPDGARQGPELAPRRVRACAEEFAHPDRHQHRQPARHLPDRQRADRARVQHPGRRPACSSRRSRRATFPSSWASW